CVRLRVRRLRIDRSVAEVVCLHRNDASRDCAPTSHRGVTVVDESYPGIYVEEFDAGAHPIAGVDTSTVGMVGVTDRGPIEAQLVTSWIDFTERFGDSVTAPEPAIRARWTLDAVDGGQWWYFGFSVKGF